MICSKAKCVTAGICLCAGAAMVLNEFGAAKSHPRYEGAERIASMTATANSASVIRISDNGEILTVFREAGIMSEDQVRARTERAFASLYRLVPSDLRPTSVPEAINPKHKKDPTA